MRNITKLMKEIKEPIYVPGFSDLILSGCQFFLT